MNTGSVLAQFTITLSKAVSEPVAVEWFTSDGTAKAGVDYAANKGMAVFAPGETAKTVDILVYGRAVGAEDRSFFVEMLPPTNAILGASIGECIIHVDTSGSQPVTQIIIPTGPKGDTGDSAYQAWLDLGNTGTEQDFINSLKPTAKEIAQEVAPLLDVGNTVLTAEGTEKLASPDKTTVKDVARRVAYAPPARIATVLLADGDNQIALSDLTGDEVDFLGNGFVPLVNRAGAVSELDWSVTDAGKLLVKGAVAGDRLYAVQYHTSSRKNRMARKVELDTLSKALGDLSSAKGGDVVFMKLPVSTAVARSLNDKFSDQASVRDFGAEGDGQADDTAEIQAAIDSLYPAGGVVYLPSGRYKITTDLKVRNMPVIFKGDGMYSSAIEQHGEGKNGITFVSDTVNNAPSTDNLLINSIQCCDISINRGLGSGGHAVSALWKIMTSNSQQAVFERFRVYSKSDAGRAWAGALELRNCNGLRISSVQLHGNPLETPLTAADPYTMKFGIRLSNDSSNALGLISFFIDKLTIIAASVGIDIFGWHEGIEISNSEIVQVSTGIRVQGDAVHQNPDLFYLNSHIEARVKCVSLSNVFKAKFTACDLLHSSAIGYAGAVIELNGCQVFSATGCAISMQRGSGSYAVSGIISASSYHGNVTGCTFLGVDSGVDVNADSWMIGNNTFYQVKSAIRLYGDYCTIPMNKYTECDTWVSAAKATHQIAAIEYQTVATMVVSNAGTDQGLTVNVPAGIFKNTPVFADVVMISTGGSIVSATYNRSASSATTAVFLIKSTSSLGAGNYAFAVSLRSPQNL